MQESEKLRAANKLTSKHIYFENFKMKAYLALQVFSRSVAKSLKFCREVLKLPDFQHSEATEEFLLIMNDIFDLFNSKSPAGIKLKGPMRTSNKKYWQPVLERTRSYIGSLTNGVTGANMTRKDPKKTGFLGIVCNIQAIERIFDNVVTEGGCHYLLTYKCSQDHLEHFFGVVRSRLGPNNNPTPREFKTIYKRLLLGVTNFKVEGSNVLLQANSEMVAIIPSPQEKINFIAENYRLDDFNFDLITKNSYSEYKTQVIEYVAGYVVKRIKEKLTCTECIDSLLGSPALRPASLITTRDYGEFMSYPSHFAQNVMNTADKILDEEMKNGNWLQKKYFFDYVCIKIAKVFVENSVCPVPCNHGYELIMKIISCYSSIILKHYMKLENEKIKKNRIRSKLNRYIINNHE